MIRLLRKRKDASTEARKGSAIVLSINNNNRGLDFLIDLIKQVRPSSHRNREEGNLKFQALLYRLQQDRAVLFSLRRALLSQFHRTQMISALTESGVVSSRSFIQELLAKIKHKFIPPQRKTDDFRYVVSRIFYEKTDYLWIESLEPEFWNQFFTIVGLQINLEDPVITQQLQKAMLILSYRVTNLGLEKEILDHYEDAEDALHPFFEQNRLVNIYLERNKWEPGSQQAAMILNNIAEMLHNCNQSLEWIREQNIYRGTSLAQTFVLVRLSQQIQRMLLVLDALDRNSHFDSDRFLKYFQTLVRNENTLNSLREFLSENLGYVAYQIAEHKGRKGEKYISNSNEEYWRLFKSALGGGFIVSFVAIFKNLLGLLKATPFWSGMMYGTNYSAGFVLMDQTDSTLATKQPAYTASAVASSLDAQKIGGKPDLKNLAVTVSKVSRSQIASFAGNLLVVFPVTYLLAWSYHAITGSKIAEGAAAMKLLEDQHPFQSLSLLYACFTGFFLFLSGLIAGYVQNHIVYGNLRERLKVHPRLQQLSEKRMSRLLNWVENGAGNFAGSVSLGFFLGMAGPIGKIFAIPFDIRHITISAGNTAIGFYGLDHQVGARFLATVIVGVLLIGFLNFLVSFSLAFFVAVKSRGIRLRDYPEFLGILFRFFYKYPMDFVRPPAGIRLPEQLD